MICTFHSRMPGKEVKQNYPTCNRAFALRMMNPTVYAEERVSVFDKEIQPVIKKPIAKNISENSEQGSVVRPLSIKNVSEIYGQPPGDLERQLSADTISLDEASLSPTDTDTSFSEMELYDIDEIEHETHEELGMIRQHSSLESYGRSKKVQYQSNNTNDIYRSHSSADGFDGHFSRGSSARATMPGRVRSGNTPSRDSQSHDGTSSTKRKGYRNEAVAYLQGKGGSKKNSKNNSDKQGTLTRSRSLKGLKGERISVGIPPEKVQNGQSSEKGKSPMATKVRVAETRSSQLRAKLHDQNNQPNNLDHKTASPFRAAGASRSGKLRQMGSFDECSESDSSSTAFSEIDPNSRSNTRSKGLTNSALAKHSKLSSSRRRLPSEQRTPSPLYTSQSQSPKSQRSNSSTPNSQQSYQLPKQDTFSSKLSQLCTLISERHPGDFQILETLVEMQSAYEERNDLVKNTISSLRERIHTLEYKLAHAPNIPGMVIPLMRATNAFQNQLQCIMDSHGVVSHDVSSQFPESKSGELTMEEISTEANNVAKEIEKLGLKSSSGSSLSSGTPPSSGPYFGNKLTSSIKHQTPIVAQENMNGGVLVNGHFELNGLEQTKSPVQVNGPVHGNGLAESTNNRDSSNEPNGDVLNEYDVVSNGQEPGTELIKVNSNVSAKNLQQENNYHNSYFHGSRRVTTDATITAMAIDSITM